MFAVPASCAVMRGRSRTCNSNHASQRYSSTRTLRVVNISPRRHVLPEVHCSATLPMLERDISSNEVENLKLNNTSTFGEFLFKVCSLVVGLLLVSTLLQTPPAHASSETVVAKIREFLPSGAPNWALVFVIAALPLLELRGAIPIG